MWKFQGSIKKEVEFPRVIQKRLCGISMGLGFWSEIPMDVTQFCRIFKGEASFFPEFPRVK